MREVLRRGKNLSNKMVEYPGRGLERCEKEKSWMNQLDGEEKEPGWEQKGKEEVRMRETCHSVSKYNVAIQSKSLLTGCLDWRSGFYLTSPKFNFHINENVV